VPEMDPDWLDGVLARRSKAAQVPVAANV
jgi:hypothetical protein